MLTETGTFNDWRMVYLLRADEKGITEALKCEVDWFW